MCAKIKEMIKNFMNNHIVAPFPYTEECWHCNKSCEVCSVDPRDVKP